MKNYSIKEYQDIYKGYASEHTGKSLESLLNEIFLSLKEDETDSFDKFKAAFLEANGINEYDYYTKNVNPLLKQYVENKIFPQYEKNDQGHGILHILEVIRRSFALRENLGLNLNDDYVYVIAACHDWGKYEEHEKGVKHAIIAGERFMNDETFNKIFSESERKLIKEAIEDHSSSLEEEPRSDYGKLVSSADRNTSIRMVFIRSFFVGKRKNPEQRIDDYLDFTFNRLSKRYSEEKSENMFFADDTYTEFLKDMRTLLKDEKRFKDHYCEVNHITSYEHTLSQEPGETSYKNLFKREEKNLGETYDK